MFSYPKTRDLCVVTIAATMLVATSAQATIIGTGDVTPVSILDLQNADVT